MKETKCIDCGNYFEPWKDIWGDLEDEICRSCDMDREEFGLWERDNFGDN